MTGTKYDAVGAIMDYESGALGARETLEMFARLIETGMAWSLQGHYGRTAAALIENGLIDRDGEITEAGWDAVEDGE